MVNQLDIEGETLTNNEHIAESFNNYFSNIGPNLASKIGTTDDNFISYIKNTKSEFAAFHPTTLGSVYNLLSGLSSNKATGIDKISSKMIKIVAPVISDSFTYIFYQSIAQSFFPAEWKITRVEPLFKSGSVIYQKTTDQFQFYRLLAKLLRELCMINL